MDKYVDVPDVLKKYMELEDERGKCEYSDPRWKVLYSEQQTLVKDHVKQLVKAQFCTLAITKEDFEDIYPHMDYPYHPEFGKIYKIYNAENDSFYIKTEDNYGSYPVGRIYENEVVCLKPVEVNDSGVAQQIAEYKALIAEAEKKLADMGIEMLSSDQEAAIDWNSSSLNC